MTDTTKPAVTGDRELVLTRIINAPRARVFAAWTNPELLKQWFAPLPWTVARAEIDLRPGGASLVTMRDPDGNEFPNHGVYLEIVKDERLVLTDAYTHDWQPSEKAFMTVLLTFEDEGEKTKYTARVRHWTVVDCKAHEEMGFHEGWGQATDQLAALVEKL